MLKDAADFIELVRQMRQAQRAYFRDRSPAALARSKELERAVDRAIAAALTTQPKLF